MPCQTESRPTRSQGLNPESGKLLGAMVEPHSGCLELSGVTVLTAFLTELLKGLDSYYFKTFKRLKTCKRLAKVTLQV